MKKINLYAVVLIGAAAMFNTSCKKSQTPDPVTELTGQGIMKVIRQERNAGNYTTISYDANGKPLTYITSLEGDATKFEVAYGENQKPVTITMDGRKLYKISYKNGQVDRVDEYYDQSHPSATPDLYTIYQYFAGHVSETISYGIYQGQNVPVTKFDYSWNASGDITETRSYTYNPISQEFVSTGIATTDYDQKKNPYAEINDLLSIIEAPQTVHNPVTTRIVSSQNILLETDNYQYTYNNSGYPYKLTVTAVVPGSDTLSTNWQFAYL